jgi:hypothetical protein
VTWWQPWLHWSSTSWVHGFLIDYLSSSRREVPAARRARRAYEFWALHCRTGRQLTLTLDAAVRLDGRRASPRSGQSRTHEPRRREPRGLSDCRMSCAQCGAMGSAFCLVAAIAATKTPHVGEARAPRLHTWLRSCCESCEGFAIHLNASRSAASKALESPQPSSRRPGCASRSKCESPHYCWYPPSPKLKRNSGGNPAPPELGLIFKPQQGG